LGPRRILGPYRSRDTAAIGGANVLSDFGDAVAGAGVAAGDIVGPQQRRFKRGGNPRSLWQPIVDLGSPAHQWVERFFWDWFTDGLRAAPSPEGFVRLWTGMIEYALASPGWDPSVNRSYDLGGIVFQLLGFDSRMNKLGQDPAFGPIVAGM
jgi:hypothetical protein